MIFEVLRNSINECWVFELVQRAVVKKFLNIIKKEILRMKQVRLSIKQLW